MVREGAGIMKKFHISIIETRMLHYEVDAETQAEAEEMAEDIEDVDAENIWLASTDIISSDVELIEEIKEDE
jgi:hypothetical protein